MEDVDYGHMRGGDLRKLRHAAALLRTIEQDPDRLDLLLELQRFLLRRICSRERVILRVCKLTGLLRSSLRSGNLAKHDAKRVKRRIGDCERCVALARRWIFLWKCFGDGAACVCQSPYNLKMLFYDKDYQVKQEAGFITGKEGLDREWDMLA